VKARKVKSNQTLAAAALALRQLKIERAQAACKAWADSEARQRPAARATAAAVGQDVPVLLGHEDALGVRGRDPLPRGAVHTLSASQ
jgi:hypothetical protein